MYVCLCACVCVCACVCLVYVFLCACVCACACVCWPIIENSMLTKCLSSDPQVGKRLPWKRDITEGGVEGGRRYLPSDRRSRYSQRWVL